METETRTIKVGDVVRVLKETTENYINTNYFGYLFIVTEVRHHSTLYPIVCKSVANGETNIPFRLDEIELPGEENGDSD